MYLNNLHCTAYARSALYPAPTHPFIHLTPPFFILLYAFRSKQVTPKGAQVIDVLVSCWLTSWLHTLDEGMRYNVVGNHSLPGHTSFLGPLPMDQSSIRLHTLQVEKAKGRAVVSVNCDPCINTLVLLLCLMGNLRVSSSWTLLSQEINMTIVFWHRRFAVWEVTCSVTVVI